MSILRRSVLYYKKPDGQYIFPGWAIVTTTLGAMLEPFNISDHFSPSQTIVDFDPSDMMVRIDELQPINQLTDWKITSFGETMPIAGGDLLPRVHKKTGRFAA
jgi:hypothetical protein